MYKIIHSYIGFGYCITEETVVSDRKLKIIMIKKCFIPIGFIIIILRGSHLHMYLNFSLFMLIIDFISP